MIRTHNNTFYFIPQELSKLLNCEKTTQKVISCGAANLNVFLLLVYANKYQYMHTRMNNCMHYVFAR